MKDAFPTEYRDPIFRDTMGNQSSNLNLGIAVSSLFLLFETYEVC